MAASSFSMCGSWLACVGADGRLKVWSTADASVAIDHAFNAPIASLAWKTSEAKPVKSRPRKRKSSQCNGGVAISNNTKESHNGDVINGGVDVSASSSKHVSDIIALGLVNGSVVLYSTRMASLLKSDLANEENGRVARNSISGLTWSGDRLFYCSLDGHVGYFESSNKHDYRLKHQRFFSLAHGPKKRTSVFVGAVSEVLWVDVEKKCVLATFGSHAVEVRFVNAINNVLITAASSDKDQSVAVWKCGTSSEEDDQNEVRNLAMLSVNEGVLSTQMVMEEDNVFRVGVVTMSGVFKTFRVEIGEKKRKKPIKPALTLQIASGDGHKVNSAQVEPLAISAFRFISSTSVSLCYNNNVFETVDTSSMEKVTCLIRAVSSSNKKTINDEVRESGVHLKVPDQSKVTVLGGSNSLIASEKKGSVKTEEGSSNLNRKRKSNRESGGHEDAITDELPMLERLRILSHDESKGVEAPRSDSLLQLLIQGVHNRDKKILDSVLDRSDDKLIHNTITKLPVQAVVPLIQELQQYVQGRGMMTHSHAKWLRSLLTNHSAFLVSNPNCEKLLKPLQAMLEMRTRHFETLIRLQSKLELITHQLRKQVGDDEEASTATKMIPDVDSLLVYQDDSSSDEFTTDIADHLLPPNEAGNKENDDDEEEMHNTEENVEESEFLALESEKEETPKKRGSRRKSRRRKSEREGMSE